MILATFRQVHCVLILVRDQGGNGDLVDLRCKQDLGTTPCEQSREKETRPLTTGQLLLILAPREQYSLPFEVPSLSRSGPLFFPS